MEQSEMNPREETISMALTLTEASMLILGLSELKKQEYFTERLECQLAALRERLIDSAHSRLLMLKTSHSSKTTQPETETNAPA